MGGRGAARVVLTATLIVGVLDFVYASLSTVLRGGSFAKLWQFVASGLLGPQAFSMGVAGALCGVVFHFLIMAVFSAVIYFLYRKMPLIRKQPIVSGFIYGIGIWLVMNFLVVPLSNAGAKAPPAELGAILNLGFAMHLIIGLLLVLITKRGLRSI